jgi:Ribonuclease G/E
MRQILAACSPGEVRVAVTQDTELIDYGVWRPGGPADDVGDLHRGRVIARVPAMAGAFIALAHTDGFLPDSAGASGLSGGDIVTVQVTRAAQGDKGPRLSLVEARVGGGIALLKRGPGLLYELALRDPDATVCVDDVALAARLKSSLGDRLSVANRAWDNGIEDQVEALAQSSVDLPGGGRLHIHPTPALTAIDVDAGGAMASRGDKVGVHSAINRSTLPALARQIRLRNLSGAILVDFAGLSAKRRAALGPALTASLAEDPLQPRLLGFTALGLAEIVRTRVHRPLHEMLSGAHAAGLEALRKIAIETVAAPHLTLSLRASPDTVAALQSDGEALPDLARRTGRALILRSDPTLRSAEWVIETSDG